MADIDPDEEPDEELPFPDYDLLPEAYLSSQMLLDSYKALQNHSKSQNAIIKHLRKKYRLKSQEILLLQEQIKALEGSIEEKRTSQALIYVLTAVWTILVGIGTTLIFTSKENVNIGIAFIIAGLIVAGFTALSFLLSRKK